MQRQDLRHVHPRDTVDGRAEDEHVDEEEGDGRGRGGVLVRLALEAQQDRHHHHAHAQPERPPHHGLAAADAVDEEGREEAADHEHDLHAAADDHGEVLAEADVGAEHGGDEVAAGC